MFFRSRELLEVPGRYIAPSLKSTAKAMTPGIKLASLPCYENLFY
jgi:hypothetical protein